jgi:acyl-CoA thioesterase-1
MHRESVLFVKRASGEASAKLLFDAAQILDVHRADGKDVFQAGRDYQPTPDGSGLVLVPGSRVPFVKESDLFKPKGSPNSIPHRVGHPDENLLFGGGRFFHEMQVEVTYTPRGDAWKGYRPEPARKQLQGTRAKLKARTPITIAVSGDSISAGGDASGLSKTPPFMPPFPDLVTAQLRKTYGGDVTLNNRAVGGWSSGNGVNDIDNLLKQKADLVVIGYGMNDVGRRNPAAFQANIKTILERIKAADPTTEVILIAPMTGNPDWVATPPEMFPKYRDALAALCGPGVALVDMTEIWLTLTQRKRYLDMTGNGVNHPNDYGHRLYAQALLALLIDPANEP